MKMKTNSNWIKPDLEDCVRPGARAYTTLVVLVKLSFVISDAHLIHAEMKYWILCVCRNQALFSAVTSSSDTRKETINPEASSQGGGGGDHQDCSSGWHDLHHRLPVLEGQGGGGLPGPWPPPPQLHSGGGVPRTKTWESSLMCGVWYSGISLVLPTLEECVVCGTAGSV